LLALLVYPVHDGEYELICCVITAKYVNGDEELRKIAEYMFKHGGYVPKHPLTRNWWLAAEQCLWLTLWVPCSWSRF